MIKSSGQTLARDAFLTLALGISTAFTHVAASPLSSESAIVESVRESGRYDLSPSDKAKLRANIKKGITQLQQLNAALYESCTIIMNDHITRESRDTEPFTQVATWLRELEVAMMDKWSQFIGMPIIGDEILALRKTLATARSRAVQNSMLIKQLVEPVEIFETETDLSGIGSLATMTSGRILKLVG